MRKDNQRKKSKKRGKKLGNIHVEEVKEIVEAGEYKDNHVWNNTKIKIEY